MATEQVALAAESSRGWGFRESTFECVAGTEFGRHWGWFCSHVEAVAVRLNGSTVNVPVANEPEGLETELPRDHAGVVLNAVARA